MDVKCVTVVSELAVFFLNTWNKIRDTSPLSVHVPLLSVSFSALFTVFLPLSFTTRPVFISSSLSALHLLHLCQRWLPGWGTQQTKFNLWKDFTENVDLVDICWSSSFCCEQCISTVGFSCCLNLYKHVEGIAVMRTESSILNGVRFRSSQQLLPHYHHIELKLFGNDGSALRVTAYKTTKLLPELVGFTLCGQLILFTELQNRPEQLIHHSHKLCEHINKKILCLKLISSVWQCNSAPQIIFYIYVS